MNSSRANSLLRLLDLRMMIRIGCLLALLECFALHALTLTWRAPESGPEVAGYYLYMREASTQNFAKIDVGNVTSHVVNDLVPGQTYVFYVTAFNPYGLESDPSNTYTYESQDQREAFVTVLEAKDAILQSNMVLLGDDAQTSDASTASPQQYLTAPIDENGFAYFLPIVPEAGTYTIWCKVIASNPDSDSMYVSINGGAEEVFEATASMWAPVWQWTRLTTRSQTNPQQVKLTQHFTAGLNFLIFRGREAGLCVSRIVISNDRNFVPAEAVAGRVPLQIRNTNYGRVLKWSSIPGVTYHVFHSPEFGKAPWTAVGEPLVAGGPETEWLAPAAQFSSGFFWVGMGR